MGFFTGRPEPQAHTYDTVTVTDWYARNGYTLSDGFSFRSLAGESVGPINSLHLSVVYACVKIIAEDIGSESAVLRRRKRDGRGKEDALDDFRFRLFHDSPNPDMGAGEFREALTANAALHGDGVARIENFGRRDMALWPLGSDTSFKTDTDKRNRTIYLIKEGNAAEKKVKRSEVFVLRGFTFDARRGDNILQRQKDAIGLGLAAQRYASEFLKNDPGASLFLTSPQKLGGDGVLRVLQGWRGDSEGRQDWPERYRHREKGDPRVLQGGMTASRVDPDMEKQQLNQTRKHQIEEIARVFRMPLHKLAHLERMTFNNIEELQIDYDSSVMNPWRRRWEEAAYRHLLTRNEQLEGRLRFELKSESRLRGRFKDQMEGFKSGLQNGLYSANQVLEWMGLNPVDGGDNRFIQMNMREIQKVAEASVK